MPVDKEQAVDVDVAKTSGALPVKVQVTKTEKKPKAKPAKKKRKKKEEELYDDPQPGSVKDEKTGKYKLPSD